MKIMLHVTPDIVQKPIISDVILETGVALNIDRANVDATSGEIVIDVDDSNSDVICEALKKRGVVVSVLSQPVIRDEDECINCGACVGVCPTGVFRYDDDWSVPMDSSKCIQCGTCINMCPHQALVLSE